MLQSANVDQARIELKNALGLDPQNKLALSLMRQLDADPIATLGRESFPYTVRPSDTLSRIAGRFLGDVYSFYILARYNGIKVPRQLASGQVIRIPGKAPPAGQVPPPPPESTPARPAAAPAMHEPPPPPPPVPAREAAPPPPPEPTAGELAMRNAAAAEQAGDLPRALNEYVNASSLGEPGAAAKAGELRAQLVVRYSADARSALARQDLDGSIANWQRVLELDPRNSAARLELEHVHQLKEKYQLLDKEKTQNVP